jgi:hypothetical protein
MRRTKGKRIFNLPETMSVKVVVPAALLVSSPWAVIIDDRASGPLIYPEGIFHGG